MRQETKKELKEVVKHKNNPSIQRALNETVKGYRLVKSQADDTNITVTNNKEETSKEVASLVFSMKQEVDKSQFVKLFISGFGALSNLKVGAKLLFEYVFSLIQENVGKDRLYINYVYYVDFCQNEEIQPVSKATFYRNLNELLENEVLYATETPCWYYINISYVFNGDRLTFLKEYVLKQDKQ